MGATAIRSAVAFPGLTLSGVITSSPDKAGRDAAGFAGLPEPTGVTATTDVGAALADCDAVAYMASGDIRPDDAITDIERCLRAGVLVVTPSLYSLYDPRSAPKEWVDRLTAAAEQGGATLLVSGVDPGWANDALAVMAAGAHRSRTGAGHRRHHRGARAAAARGVGRHRDGALREGHAGRLPAQDRRLVRRQEARRRRRRSFRVVEAIYQQFGIELTDAARAAMEQSHEESKQGPRAPKHTYSLADYGLTDEQVKERFKGL